MRGYQPRSNLMKDENGDPQHFNQVEELLLSVIEGA
jgi:hypothetical protein